MIVNPGVRRNLGGGVSRARSSVGFIAPLTSSLTLARGIGTLTDTRAGATATVIDFEGNVKTALANEARFTGARRVRNAILDSALFSSANWVLQAGATVTQISGEEWELDVTACAVGSGMYQGLAGILAVGSLGYYRPSIDMRVITTSGTNQVGFDEPAGIDGTKDGVVFATPVMTLNIGAWTTYSWLGRNTATPRARGLWLRKVAGGANVFRIRRPQLEDVTNQSNQNPSEYVPSTWNDTGAAGVRYFEYLNGNTVTNNVVTEAQGAPIPAATLKGYLPEPAATNYFLNSGAPATQTTGSLGVGTYCCWVQGAGNIAIAGGTATITGAGSATAATPLVFNVTVAGTVVCTYTATLTFVQLENNPFPTSRIDTAGATVTRNADPLTEPTASNILASSGTLYGEFTPNHAPLAATSLYLFGTYVDANNSTSVLHDGTNLIFRKRIAGVNYDATIALAYVSGTAYKWAASWGASGTTIVLNGVAGTPHANTTAAQIAATMQEGTDGNGAGQPTMNLRNRRIWPAQLPVATQQALTI